MDSTMRAAQSVVGALAGDQSNPVMKEPPVNGPPNVEEAAADFANRLTLLALDTRMKPTAVAGSWEDVLGAALKTFGSLDPKTLRQWMALPIQVPLSIGVLLAQVGLRGFHGTCVAGVESMPELIADAAEFWTDVEVFTSLQYKEQLSRLVERVRQDPDDARWRLALGHIYIKLGRYAEATEELAAAAKNQALRAPALQESLVANYYAGNFSRAVADGAASLELRPSSDRTRFWLWLAAQKLKGYPPEVPEHLRMAVKVGHHPPKVQLEDVAQKIGLDKTSAGRGTAVFDIDGDGYLDVVIASNHAGCSVYRNNGDGTFTDASVGSGLEYCYDTFAIAVGDYNNDGWDDLYITRLGFYPGESVLYRNNGDGTFTDVTKEAGVQNWGTAFTAEWVDYDCDGHLDLFVTGNQGRLFGRNTPSRLFHNNGDGAFTDVTRRSGIAPASGTIGCAWGDYNNDGYPDLFLSGFGRAQLFRNNGDGTFTDVSREAGIDNINLGFISLWCDYDNDGWLDLIQFVWSPEDDVLHTLIHGKRPPKGHPLNIYHNNGDGTFTLMSSELGLDECWGTMCGNAGDFNNDGYIDLLLGNGAPPMYRTEPPTLYEFDAAAGKFHNVTFAAGLPFTGKGHGANMADLAGDGRLCLIIAAGGMYPADLLTTAVYRPVTLPGNFLNVRVAGTKSNRNAIGARLKLEAGGRSQHRLVSGGSGFGCLPFEQHFGLGKLGRADSLEIVWPSGMKQRLENLPVNNTIRIVEGKPGWKELYKTAAQAVAYSV